MKTLDDGSIQWKVNTGGEFSEWVAPGYAIEVLKGGYVVKTEAPSGPAADASLLASCADGGSVQGYARNAVAWAISNGLLTGYGDGTIRPGSAATRAEVCALVMRYLG